MPKGYFRVLTSVTTLNAASTTIPIAQAIQKRLSPVDIQSIYAQRAHRAMPDSKVLFRSTKQKVRFLAGKAKRCQGGQRREPTHGHVPNRMLAERMPGNRRRSAVAG